MKPIDYVIIAVVASIVGLIIFYFAKNKKEGKSACGSCGGCPYSADCSIDDKKQKQN